MTNARTNNPADRTGSMRINVWQACRLAEVLTAIDEAREPADDTLKTAYALVELKIIDGDPILTVKSEAGPYSAIWHDGTDCTDDYPED